jgi:hypothetical protein
VNDRSIKFPALPSRQVKGTRKDLGGQDSYNLGAVHGWQADLFGKSAVDEVHQPPGQFHSFVTPKWQEEELFGKGIMRSDRRRIVVVVSDPTSPAAKIADHQATIFDTLSTTGLKRVGIALGERPLTVHISPYRDRQRGYIAKGWRKSPPRTLREEFILEGKLVARVRDIDRDAGTFTTLLSDDPSDTEGKMVATFRLRTLSTDQVDVLQPGSLLTLVTGSKRIIRHGGRVVENELVTKFFMRDPRTLSAEELDEALTVADRLFDNE